MYPQDDLIPISALQHLAFCERQAALIHIEGLWDENVLTVQGEQLHERVHGQEAETFGNRRTVRGLRIRSLRLGLIGVADVVEFHGGSGVAVPGLGDGLWQPYIVEYKRGKPKWDRSDEVQLCAQAVCLEEMLGATIFKSAFFYGTPRRREEVTIDDSLRSETERLAEKARRLIREGKTPPPDFTPKCRSCSLLEQCLPRVTASPAKVDRYMKGIFDRGPEP